MANFDPDEAAKRFAKQVSERLDDRKKKRPEPSIESDETSFDPNRFGFEVVTIPRSNVQLGFGVSPPPPPPDTFYIAMETSGIFLMETSGGILLE